MRARHRIPKDKGAAALPHHYLPKHYKYPRKGGVWRLIHKGFKAIDALSKDRQRRFPQRA